MTQRYFISADDSGHDYCVPVDREDDWYAWLNSEDFADAPDYAIRFEGTLTFTDPRTE